MTINVKNFFDSDGHIRPELLDSEAMGIAKEFSKTKLSTHQVRKFFDEVKLYKSRIDKGDEFKDILPLIVMLKSKAKYAAIKKKDMNIFYEFIQQCIKQVKDGTGEENQKKNFYAFCLFFEAVYGFANLKK